MRIINHPLINKDSAHYRKDGRETILDIEDDLTICELIGACKFNIRKYRLREKGQNELDEIKIKTYADYMFVLADLKQKAEEKCLDTEMVLSKVKDKLKIYWDIEFTTQPIVEIVDEKETNKD